jgi:hypothetical protein
MPILHFWAFMACCRVNFIVIFLCKEYSFSCPKMCYDCMYIVCVFNIFYVYYMLKLFYMCYCLSVHVSLLLGVFATLRKAIISFVISVCPSVWNSSAPTRLILKKLSTSAFIRKNVEKLKFHLNPIWITGTLHEDVFTFLTISRWVNLKMRMA